MRQRRTALCALAAGAPAVSLAASEDGARQGRAGRSSTAKPAPALRLNDLEYLEMPGLNVMLAHDYYPEGHQGGVGIIQIWPCAVGGMPLSEVARGFSPVWRPRRATQAHAGRARWAACPPGLRVSIAEDLAWSQPPELGDIHETAGGVKTHPS